MHQYFRRAAVPAAMAIIGGILAACSGPAPMHSQAPSGDTTQSARTDSHGTDAAVAAYRQMWADLEAAGVTADPESPRLAEHASGAALNLLRYGMSKDRQNGVVARGEVRLAPEVASAEPSGTPTRVEISDCSDDSSWLLYKKDGSLQNSVPGGRSATTATVEQVNGRWKVTKLYIADVGSC